MLKPDALAPSEHSPPTHASASARSSFDFNRVLDLLFKAVEGLMALLLVIMLVMVAGNVILRYGFGSGISVSEELSRTMFVWITFVGAVVATRDGTHLGVDSLVASLGHGGRVVCAVASELIVLVCCVLIFWGTWRQHEVNATTNSLVAGIPLIWVFGVGYIVAGGIGLLTVKKLWGIFTGKVPDAELFGKSNVDEKDETKTEAAL